MPKRKPWRRDPAVRLALDLAGRELIPYRSNLPAALERLTGCMHDCERRLRLIRKAESAGYTLALQRLNDDLPALLQALRGGVDQAMVSLAAREVHSPVLAGTVLAELRGLQNDFGEVLFDDGTVSVHTDPIVLEDVRLGAFRIELNVDNLKNGQADLSQVILAEALDSNTAAGNDSVTHPHVQNGVVCLGDATMPVRLALQQGRLFDVVQMIRSVLNTYNDGSAYVALDEWNGQPCDHCGRAIPEDESSTCEGCDQVLCERCTYSCDVCNGTFCHSCLHDDPAELLCNRCRGVCNQCGNTVRTSRLDGGRCLTCREQEENEDESQEEPVRSIQDNAA